MIDLIQVGMKITDCRKKKSMTQEALADRLFVTRQAVSKWENGMGIPSTEILVELSQIFQISVEELLCLDDDISVDPHDLFRGHDRGYIIRKIICQELKVSIPDILYQLSPEERMQVLWAIREKRISCNLRDLYVKLTVSEQKFMQDFIKGGKRI